MTHPKNCGTCTVDVKICPITKGYYDGTGMNILLRRYQKDFTALVGCASWSNGQPQQKKCYDGTDCIDGKSDACNICYIPLQKGEKISCKLHVICKFTQSDCFSYNPDFNCNMDTRPHTPAATDRGKVLDELVSMLIEPCSENYEPNGMGCKCCPFLIVYDDGLQCAVKEHRTPQEQP